jgi:hypothetical protein
VALEGKWRAILIGGLITGLGPFVPILNLACCVFPILGSIVAVAVYRSSSSNPPTNNDGIVLGVMTAVVGTLIYGLLLGPVTLIFGGILQSFLSAAVPSLADAPEEIRPLLEFFFTHFGTVVGVAVFSKIVARLGVSLVFGIMGGILGVAILKPRAAPV